MSTKQTSLRQRISRAAAYVTLLWLAQPPLNLWPLAMVAVVPLLSLAAMREKMNRRCYLVIWGIFSFYWLVSLQGLRHAHPAMVLCLIALAGYLAFYQVLFVGLLRQAVRLFSKDGQSHTTPILFGASIIWVGATT
jgi:apolipoprotein N-acyltransferase